MDLASGDRVDRYVLRTRLGEGGQGEVWRADDLLAPDQPKALKLVRVASASATQLERLRREARRLVQLRHPSLVACHALFEDLHHEVVGVAMEYADGQPLDELIGDATMTEQDRLLLLAHIASALAYVHQRNVVHRDIKPENVVVTRGFRADPTDPSTVKLIDFGIAVESDNPRPLTKVGHVIGTPPYLAPELIDPSGWNHSGAATPTSDVFAFGVLAWKLLLGDLYAHPTELGPRAQFAEYAIVYRQSAGQAWPRATMSAAWFPLVARCLALHAHDRLQDGLEVLTQLAAVMPGIKLPTAEHAVPTPSVGSVVPVDQAPTIGYSGAGQTEPAAPSIRQSTPQVSVRTVPSLPDVRAVPSGAERVERKRRVWPWLMFAIGVGVLGAASAAIAVAWYAGLLPDSLESAFNATSPAASPPPVATPAIATAPAPTSALASTAFPASPAAARTVAPTPTAPPRKTAAPAPAAPPVQPDRPNYYTLHGCVPRGDDLCTCCPSGHDCLGSSCGAHIWPTEAFELRVGGADSGGMSLEKVHPGFQICLQRVRLPTREVCASVEDLAVGRVERARLPVVWRDVTVDGIQVTIRDANGQRKASGIFKRSDIGQRGVACSGMVVGPVPGPDVTVDHVSVFVDSPNSQVPENCPPRR